MILDIRQFPTGQHFDADLCIVGAGAAGISIARDMLGLPIKVLLLESGGFDFDAEVAALNEADNAADLKLDLESFRARLFGGTTSLWGGNCAPLDPIDFAPRPWVPFSGWPIKHEEMLPYWQRAQPLFELGDRGYDVDEWVLAEPDFEVVRLPLDTGLVREKVYQRSPRTQFGHRYGGELEPDSANVTVMLNGTAVGLRTDDSAGTVTGLEVRTLTGRSHTISARAVVLAAGIENARLLLLSNDREPAGLGNRHDAVGRYFMEHLNMVSGRAMIPGADDLYRFYDAEGWADRTSPTAVRMLVGLQPTPEMQEAAGIGNYVAFINRTFEGEQTAGYQALRHLLYRLRHAQLSDHLRNDLAALVGDFGSALKGSWNRVFAADTSIYEIQHFFEQVPNPDSRIRLGDRPDPLGMPRMVVDWRTTDQDKRTWAVGQDLVARAIGAGDGTGGTGRLQLEPAGPGLPWPDTIHQSSHYMGTTRISDDPRLGVVDHDCRVHGLSNLFVAGGSVLPTGGCAMVTINIVALALRLADHLKRLLA
ncbi:GMC family oxidoreductase [Skermanella sp. TT6]|uniref:GMC family oxidoreductase n=1 Tax=Skermanella cutis TaxID=2775420 RepID=A0ABX7B0I1_9PROT|nr:GMC family oxidoreductase [Skermanella sp. TT6]QQP87838.1 GMC family oxidoreductase [Skermanella sp. TT6]